MQERHPPKISHLLAALPVPEWQRWLPQLEWVGLPLGHVVYESGTTLEHVYFPTNGVDLVMTQELIFNMLGVRREGVTEGALKLQKAGLIRYNRGHITVLGRPGLERRTCECYAVEKKEYDRLLPDEPAS